MIFTRVDLPAPFSPSSAWISAGHRSRSMWSFATNVPNSLVIPTACSKDCPLRAGCDGSAIAHAERRRGVMISLRADSAIAGDEQLSRDRSGDGGGGLILDLAK